MVWCPSVRQKPVFYRNSCMDRAGFRHRGHTLGVRRLCYKGIRVSPKNKDTSFGNLVPNTELRRRSRHGTARRPVASVVNLIRPSKDYHTERPRLFTTRWKRHAETCTFLHKSGV